MIQLDRSLLLNNSVAVDYYRITTKRRNAMSDPLTCGVRTVTAPDGTQIPVPVGGLGLPSGAVIVSEDAEVQIAPTSTGGFQVVINNTDPSNNEAANLFAEFTQETAIARLEQLAAEAFAASETIAISALGLIGGVLATLITPSKLTREVIIRATLEMPQPVDGPPVTYLLLV
jgi:hypothetical protein